MRRPPASPARRSLAVAACVFVTAALGVAFVQGVQITGGDCEVWTWSPLRGLPWVPVALAPVVVYELAFAWSRRVRSTPTVVGDGPYRQSVVDPLAPTVAPRAHRIATAAMLAVGLVLGIAEGRHSTCPYAVPASCRPTVHHIVLVGVGKHDVTLVDDLARHFRDCYGLSVIVGAPFAAPRTAWNPQREQWVAEDLLAAIESEPNTLTIGVTSDDMYMRGEDWRFVFGSRDSGHRKAILSTAMMRNVTGGVYANVRKYVARMIAFEYCDLPRVNDPKSVRANTLMGTNDLDEIEETVW